MFCLITLGSYHIDLRIRHLSHESSTNDMKNMDTLIIEQNESLDLESIFKIFNTRRPKKSILVVDSTELEDFKMAAMNFKQNSYFYLLVHKSESDIEWYTLRTLYNEAQFLMNEINFDSMGRVVENFDMKGKLILN